MAKARNVRGRKSMLSGWQTQTRDLLNKLLKERPVVVDQLAAIDAEIALLRNALGRSAGAAVAARPAAKKAGPKARGGIAAAVLGVLGSRDVATVQQIVDKTGLDRGQVYPCLMNLKAQKKIVAAERGSYRLTARGAKAAKAKPAAKKAKAKKTKAGKAKARKTKGRKTAAKKTRVKTKRKTKAGGKGSRGPRGAVSGTILKVLGSNPKGVTRPKLISATGMDERQVSACIMNLKKAGKIKTVARGVYAVA